MRGSVHYQVAKVLEKMRAIGTSRHDAKQEIEYSNQHQLGQQTDIYSYKTLDTYKAVARDLLQFTKDQKITKDIEKLTAEHISAYLDSKIDNKVSYNTIKTYSAALNKLAVGLTKLAIEKQTGAQYDFSAATAKALQVAKAEIGIKEQHRAFADPQSVIKQIKNEKYKIIAEFQHKSGLRISELNHICPESLITVDKKNYLSVENNAGKGGKDRIIEVKDSAAFSKFKDLVKAEQRKEGKYAGKFIFSKSSYNNYIRAAAHKVGEKNTGSHAFRWNYAQKNYVQSQVAGKEAPEAKQFVSGALGHNRPRITEHYLK